MSPASAGRGPPPAGVDAPSSRQRLDKWLWFARFTKTRSAAARLVVDGFVRVNGQRAGSAAKPVGPGDVLTIAAEHRTATVRVARIGSRRGPAPEARTLYDELDRERDDAALVTTGADE